MTEVNETCFSFQAQTHVVRSPVNEKGIDDIIKVIQELIQKIQQIISDIGAKVAEVIKKLEDKIKEIISGLNLKEIIEKIKQQIENIIGQASQKVKECIEKQSEAINQLAQEEMAGVQACVSAAQAATAPLQEQMKNLLNKANDIRTDITNRVAKCINDNGLNPPALIECLKAQVEPVKAEIMALEKDIEAFIASAQEIGQQAAADLDKCMTSLAADLQVKEQAIVEEIRKCIVA